jgi:hypothetical protein
VSIFADHAKEGTMDPITTAILAVIPALATDVAKSSVNDAYEGLKAVIRRKWGDTAPVARAITALEEHPKKAQAAVLEEKIAAVKATEDRDVLQALQNLVEQMKKDNIGGEDVARINIEISGGTNQGVIGADMVHIANMSFGAPPKG